MTDTEALHIKQRIWGYAFGDEKPTRICMNTDC